MALSEKGLHLSSPRRQPLKRLNENHLCVPLSLNLNSSSRSSSRTFPSLRVTHADVLTGIRPLKVVSSTVWASRSEAWQTSETTIYSDLENLSCERSTETTPPTCSSSDHECPPLRKRRLNASKKTCRSGKSGFQDLEREMKDFGVNFLPDSDLRNARRRFSLWGRPERVFSASLPTTKREGSPLSNVPLKKPFTQTREGNSVTADEWRSYSLDRLEASQLKTPPPFIPQPSLWAPMKLKRVLSSKGSPRCRQTL